MGRASRDTGKYLKYGIIALSVVFLISAGLLLLEIWEKGQGNFPQTEQEESTVEYEGQKYVLKDGIETLLVLGLDKYDGAVTSDSYNNDQQADFLMLFVFDNIEKKYTAIQINRDTVAEVNVLGVAGNKIDTVSQQIALAHTYGNGKDLSCRNTADAVSALLRGVKVNHYVSMKMDSVIVLNDLVGGVTVTVLDDFTGIDDTLVQGETVTLMGEQALRYVRTRQGLEDSSNASRMERQQQYVKALRESFKTCVEEDDEFVVEASLEMADYLITDRSVTQLQEISRKMDEYKFGGILDIEGTNKVGEDFMEFSVDEKAVEKLVIEQFYELKK
ncbi:MAG: LCP family protein [Clostridia bacterium]|nr:LCP family protein [Clostridia bacterium]MBQ8235870.1 LCP family protein [Clostridia bacterium]MBQ8399297.1 LCP family protein [Clostridia bacterium]